MIKSLKNKIGAVKRLSSWVNKNLKKTVAVVAAIVFIVVATYYRGHDFYDCTMAKYDLKRETNFRLLTGKCTVTGKDGNQVYINQIRGIGEEDL